MLVDYYNQYATPQSPGGQRSENMDGILSEMEKNQSQIQMQNFEIEQLQDRVSQFLRLPSGGEEQKHQTLPPISGGLNKSESQPVFANDYYQTTSSGMSHHLKRDEGQYPGRLADSNLGSQSKYKI